MLKQRIKQLFTCCFCRLARRKSADAKVHERGRRRFEYWSDICTLARSLQTFNLMFRTVFTKEQQTLMRFHKGFVIGNESDDANHC